MAPKEHPYTFTWIVDWKELTQNLLNSHDIVVVLCWITSLSKAPVFKFQWLSENCLSLLWYFWFQYLTDSRQRQALFVVFFFSDMCTTHLFTEFWSKQQRHYLWLSKAALQISNVSPTKTFVSFFFFFFYPKDWRGFICTFVQNWRQNAFPVFFSQR